MYIKLLIPLVSLIVAVVLVTQLDLIGAIAHVAVGFVMLAILIVFTVVSAYLIIKRKW
jgi:hypothetical protein